MHVRVVDREGEERELEALEGWRLMEIIRDWGLPIKAECGGACACATCHVYVAQDWVEKLHPPLEDELDRLDEAYDVRPNSRLACQILFSPELDGLTVVLAPDLA
jgi:2Fe-2S ferredoxin